MNPIRFGYQQMRIGPAPDVVSEGRRLLEVFATRQGVTPVLVVE